ncbi:hypothetical protein WOLCODRAFT_147062 [Wolfiporia cocos MD-104 SS10]|uniref:Uncharacterized protein n=1 Tax=Wolfiporia cocos (strain MD-104) TaxID=742152 RepID=A0A2H3ITC7_WOLCO|nr:hypothetical protein WOLCODRAFT_147062 [Wolfiporia cocos MD-104 SS10]
MAVAYVLGKDGDDLSGYVKHPGATPRRLVHRQPEDSTDSDERTDPNKQP